MKRWFSKEPSFEDELQQKVTAIQHELRKLSGGSESDFPKLNEATRAGKTLFRTKMIVICS